MPGIVSDNLGLPSRFRFTSNHKNLFTQQLVTWSRSMVIIDTTCYIHKQLNHDKSWLVAYVHQNPVIPTVWNPFSEADGGHYVGWTLHKKADGKDLKDTFRGVGVGHGAGCTWQRPSMFGDGSFVVAKVYPRVSHSHTIVMSDLCVYHDVHYYSYYIFFTILLWYSVHRLMISITSITSKTS